MIDKDCLEGWVVNGIARPAMGKRSIFWLGHDESELMRSYSSVDCDLVSHTGMVCEPSKLLLQALLEGWLYFSDLPASDQPIDAIETSLCRVFAESKPGH